MAVAAPGQGHRQDAWVIGRDAVHGPVQLPDVIDSVDIGPHAADCRRTIRHVQHDRANVLRCVRYMVGVVGKQQRSGIPVQRGQDQLTGSARAIEPNLGHNALPG